MKTWLFVAALLLSTGAFGNTITYQGQLEDGGGNFSGTVNMEFQLFQSEAGNDPIGPEISQNVSVAAGLFQVELNLGNQPYQDGLWLQVTVDGTVLTPRQRITAAPLAVRSLDAGPVVIMADDGAIAMPTGTTHCITDPYTPAFDSVAVAQIGLSGRNDAVGSTTLFVRFLISTDDGVTWSQVSGRISPEDQITNTTQGAISYTDVALLTAGTTYRFAVRAFGGLASGRCNLVIVAAAGTAAQVIDAGAPSAAPDSNDKTLEARR